MRYLLAGLMMSLVVTGVALADDAAASKYDVTGLPIYQGPEYSSTDSNSADVTVAPQFHSFQHRPVDEVGYSPLTLEDFRFPVVKRTMKEFSLEREYYPKHSQVVWHDQCHGFTVSAFFFTRDMVRDHIQRLIDEYYICEPDLAQQLIDYYAEVTPQCGEAVSWVWFRVDEKGHSYSDQLENRYFTRYLANFKDKFYLEFGLPKAQNTVDEGVNEFLYQYQKRGKYNCGPEFKPFGCEECGGKGCGECKEKDCGPDCPVPQNKPHDDALDCRDFRYSDFSLDVNAHYLYAPRKVVIEDITWDPVAQAYRWKFAWRFNECEVNWLNQLCQYGEQVEFALVLSDPTWYAYAPLAKGLKRDILASIDPQTWGNVWPAGNLPFDTTCCECMLPGCPGNCTPAVPVGWAMAEPTPEPVPAVTPPPAEQNDFNYFPPPKEEQKEEVIAVPGKG